jgi:asparagine synthase (glutamine-hydrolysing)
MASWLRGRFGDFALAIWNESGVASSDYLDRDGVRKLFAEHRAGAADHSRLLYAILIFSLWWTAERKSGQFASCHAL